eukprot:3923011-Prymnesium_polylepis.6
MRLVDDHLCRRLPPRSDARLHLNSSTFDRNNARTSLERIVKNEDAAQHGSTLERILHARADPAHYEIAQRLVARDKEHRRLWLSQQPLKHQVHGNERTLGASRAGAGSACRARERSSRSSAQTARGRRRLGRTAAPRVAHC